jgi:hypothetical protein
MKEIELQHKNDPKRDSSKNGQVNTNPSEDEEIVSFRKNISVILLNLFFIICHLILIYVVKPMVMVIEFIFLTSIQDIEILLENGKLIDDKINNGVLTIGWFILLILPLYHLFSLGIKIIFIQNSIFRKLNTLLYILIEIMLNIPIPFMYSSNLYSVFLFEEKGVKQILAPWLIFFPTKYISSFFEIFRNFVDPIFFFILGLIKLGKISTNIYQSYPILVLYLMLSLCFLRVIGNLFILIIKIRGFVNSKKSELANIKKTN